MQTSFFFSNSFSKASSQAKFSAFQQFYIQLLPCKEEVVWLCPSGKADPAPGPQQAHREAIPDLCRPLHVTLGFCYLWTLRLQSCMQSSVEQQAKLAISAAGFLFYPVHPQLFKDRTGLLASPWMASQVLCVNTAQCQCDIGTQLPAEMFEASKAITNQLPKAGHFS